VADDVAIILAYFAINCHYTPDQVLSMSRGTIAKLVPAISAIREVAAKIQEEAMNKNSPKGRYSDPRAHKGPVKDHNGVDLSEFDMRGLRDLVEEK